MLNVARCASVVAALALPALAPTLCRAAPVQLFTGTLDELNNSGVSGTVRLALDGTTLNVQIDATGLEADQPHAQHIHGLLNGGFANCPTLQQDTNGDGFISVLEGAAPYGPIKVSLTNPPTPFGPPANTTLFAPFAGVPNASNFPTAPGGQVHFTETIHFDLSKADDAAAFASINPLTKQHVVLHGMMAPETVDAAPLGIMNPDPAKIIYDPLIPVACAEIAPATSAVPLPPAVYSGSGMLALIGGCLMLRRRLAAA